MTTPACARCSKPVDPAYRPFCSRRCADVDLQRWLSGSYAIPARPEDDDEADSVPRFVSDDED